MPSRRSIGKQVFVLKKLSFVFVVEFVVIALPSRPVYVHMCVLQNAYVCLRLFVFVLLIATVPSHPPSGPYVYRGCLNRVAGGETPGRKNQPCTQRWCRTKAAQRHADKEERVRGVTTMGGPRKRPLDRAIRSDHFCFFCCIPPFVRPSLHSFYCVFYTCVYPSVLAFRFIVCSKLVYIRPSLHFVLICVSCLGGRG